MFAYKEPSQNGKKTSSSQVGSAIHIKLIYASDIWFLYVFKFYTGLKNKTVYKRIAYTIRSYIFYQ